MTEAAEVLGVGRPALSSLLNEKASLSPEMALRIDKALGVKMDTLLRMQARYDAHNMRKHGLRPLLADSFPHSITDGKVAMPGRLQTIHAADVQAGTYEQVRRLGLAGTVGPVDRRKRRKALAEARAVPRRGAAARIDAVYNAAPWPLAEEPGIARQGRVGWEFEQPRQGRRQPWREAA